MATCFLFTQGFGEGQCLCLKLSSLGQVEFPLAMCSFEEIRTLQLNARTIVVIPTETSSLHQVEFPWLSERKARAAIPYALEERLAQDVSTLHFSFDRQHYQQGHYQVVVTDKGFLEDLIAKLDAAKLSFDLLTLDWFALNPDEICAMETVLLVRDSQFNGALSGELLDLYLTQQLENPPLLLFKDSDESFKKLSGTIIDSLACVWIAQRLLEASPINICQGELAHDNQQYDLLFWYRAAAGIAGSLLISVLLLNAFHLHVLNKKIFSTDQKISVIYHEFFPDASQVISPKFRISQWLTAGFSNDDSAALWFLLDKLAGAYQQTQTTIEQFHFQSRVLSVTLITKDFATLEDLQQRLQLDKVKVTQSQAASQKNQVQATLELSL